MKQKKDLSPGVRYRGYGFINEYGEFQFEPEDTGSRQGQTKFVVQNENYTVAETSKYVLVRAKIEKEGSNIDRLKKFLNIFNELITIFREYDF
jgi:hypothetical protein